MEHNINETLLSARKAYRFLYEYQSKILDLVSYIGSKYGIDYNSGYPHFSDMIKKHSSAYLDCWAWDWLNMYFYEFHFYKELSENEKLRFSIFHMSDSGYYDNLGDELDKNGSKKLQINTFKDVETSESKLIFVIGKNFWVEDCVNWGGEWSYHEFNSKPFGKLTNEQGGILLFKQYPLTRFSNETDTLICMQDFQKYCQEHNIALEIQENIFQK